MTDQPDSSSTALDDYRVDLDAYHGPLDLLLYLVKRHEIDLYDIPVAKLTDQYLEHLALMDQIDVEVAGEFLVMAATLLEIKSQMLLPRIKAADDSEDGEANEGDDAPGDGALTGDPRLELVRQLLAYKRYKDAAGELDQRRDEWDKRFAHRPARVSRTADQNASSEDADGETNEDSEAAPIEIDLEDASVVDLCKAFARLMDSIGQTSTHDVVYDDTPIALHQEDILDRLKRDGGMTLQQIFIGRQRRGEMVGLFLATLELVKLRQLRVVQDTIGGEITLELWPENDPGPDEAATPDWRDPETGEVDYDWPSEQAKKSAERRARLRASRLTRLKEGADDATEDVDQEDEDVFTIDDERDDIDDPDVEVDDPAVDLEGELDDQLNDPDETDRPAPGS